MFDNILHQPVRSKLMATLISNEELPFKALKEKLELTDGNLASHLKKLEEVEYINIEKSFEGKRVKTVVKVSNKGIKAFKTYIKQLKQFVQEN